METHVNTNKHRAKWLFHPTPQVFFRKLRFPCQCHMTPSYHAGHWSHMTTTAVCRLAEGCDNLDLGSVTGVLWRCGWIQPHLKRNQRNSYISSHQDLWKISSFPLPIYVVCRCAQTSSLIDQLCYRDDDQDNNQGGVSTSIDPNSGLPRQLWGYPLLVDNRMVSQGIGGMIILLYVDNQNCSLITVSL